MVVSAKAAPPNSLVLLSGSENSDIPETMVDVLVASTMSCIAIGCQSDIDGATEFTLGTIREVDPGYEPVFQGSMMTPNRTIAVRAVTGATILEASVSQHQTIIRVWVNDLKEPDRVIIGFA